ncbi:50S ribosomal protein L4 [Fusobacterium sp. PH5-44]|uniref:50S ribosomal protein L4 n=1 Tax=unclassified Fusobacterium TaxID=2648384 RepID=UPI003D1DE2B6
MAVLNIYNLTGEQTGTVEVKDTIFGIKAKNEEEERKTMTVLHEVLTAELASAREGNASTKTRSMVRGGGRKPFKQKGTGRARQGTIRAPHMVGGGVTFGPHPRSYDKKVNKKVRRLALRYALSQKVADNAIVVLDGSMEKPHTQTIANLANKLEAPKKQLFVINDFVNEGDYTLYLSARNIPTAMTLHTSELCVYWLLKQEKVIITKDALSTLEEVLG